MCDFKYMLRTSLRLVFSELYIWLNQYLGNHWLVDSREVHTFQWNAHAQVMLKRTKTYEDYFRWQIYLYLQHIRSNEYYSRIMYIAYRKHGVI